MIKLKIGIVYYSRTGNTKQAARILEEKLKQQKADVELLEIQHVKKPGFFKAGSAASKQTDLPIANTDFNLKKYDYIIAGTPIWAGKPAPFVKTFMNKAKNIKGKKAAIFMVGNSDINERDNAIEIIKNDLEKTGFKNIDNFLSLQIKKGEIKTGEEKIDEFLKNIFV